MKFLIVTIFCLSMLPAHAQEDDRITIIKNQLTTLGTEVPGLLQKTEVAISGGSLKDFLQALAQAHQLNINTDPRLQQSITHHFVNETVVNILVYLTKQYNLDISFTGSILTITPWVDPRLNAPPPPRPLLISWDTASRSLTLDLRNDTLPMVAKRITVLSNKNIVVVPDLYNRQITGYYQNMSLESVLEKIALTNQLKITKTNDDSYVIEPLKQDEELVTRQTINTNPDFAIRKVNRSPNGNTTGSIQLNEINGKRLLNLNVTGTPIREVIKSLSEQAGINYFLYSEIGGMVTANVINQEFDEILKMVLLGTPYTFHVNTNGIYMIGDRNFEGLRVQRMIRLQYRSVDSLLVMIPEEFKRNVVIKEFKELNGFLVNGSEPQINEIEQFVKHMDKKVPMVTIEVIIMDVSKGKSISTGLKVGISDSVKTGGTILGDGLNFTLGAKSINNFIDKIGLNNVFNIGHVTPNFYAQLRALESSDNIDLRQTPKLSTLNGHSAQLSIGSTRYYAVTTQNVIGSLNPSTVVTQQFYPVEANLALDVTPFVSGDENVTLTLGVNISDFTSTTNINQPPPTSSSKFKSIIRVKNEEMVLLGGIERTNKSESSSGIPLLSRIPVLKWLFSSRTRSNSKVVSIVFIKPSIVF